MNERHKKYVEAKMKRGSGQSETKRIEVQAKLASMPIMIRCWKCKTYQTGMHNELRLCVKCGSNMWVKDDVTSA